MVLTAAPSFAFAMGCSSGHTEASMSCANGTVWDADSKTCVTASS
ncbi:carbohydrate-binding module family 14 protein [Algirhabdus cladophorae]